MKRLIKVGGKEIQIAGRFLRIACPDADGYEYVEDPEQLIACVKKSGSRNRFAHFQKDAARYFAKIFLSDGVGQHRRSSRHHV